MECTPSFGPRPLEAAFRGRGEEMERLNHTMHRGTGATCRLGCYVTPLGLKSPPPQDWVSGTTWISPSKMCRQQKGRRKNCTENVALEFKQRFCWLTLPFSRHSR